MTGTVKNIVADRGFGFLSTGGQDYFFHVKELRDLEFNAELVGRVVQFEPVRVDHGRWKALEVRPI